MYFPDLQTFAALAAQGNLIPVYREIMADMDTPVTAFKKIDDGSYSFLLESIEGGRSGGVIPFSAHPLQLSSALAGRLVEILKSGEPPVSSITKDPLGAIRDYLARFKPVEVEGLPRFFGGAVGYLGYDMVRFFENLRCDKPAEIGAWDSCFLITDTLLIFDSVRQKIKVVANAHLDGVSPEEAYAKALAQDRLTDSPA